MPDTAQPAAPRPLEVVITGAAQPVPVTLAADARPSPPPPDPTVEQLRNERVALYASNHGGFAIEDKPPLPAPSHAAEPVDKTFTVLVILCIISTVKLCLILWVLLTVVETRDLYIEATARRAAIEVTLATLQKQLDQGVAQQQVLINRVDDALVRLQTPPAR